MSLARSLAAAAAAAALLGCAPRAVVVRSDGWAPEDAARPGTASRRATTDALRRAVERADGVRLFARTRVRDGAAVSERVSAEASGCVLGYSVLSDRVQSGGRSVRLRVRVARAASGCAGPPAGLGARVAVSYEGDDAASRGAAREAAQVLSGELARRGWAVVAGSAPLTVSVDAAETPAPDALLAPLTGARVELDVRVETASGRILGRASARAAAVDVDARSAERAAARAAAEQAAGPAADALTGGYWSADSGD